MSNRNTFAKVLVTVGTLLVWAPIAFMLYLAFTSAVTEGRFRFDYLIPAELGIVEFVGGLLVVVGAALAKSHVRGTLGGLILALAGFGLMVWIADATGLASGRVKAEGWPFMLTIGMLALFYLGLILLGVAGFSLMRKLFGTAAA